MQTILMWYFRDMIIPTAVTKLLYGDGQTHGTYEFSLTEDGTDYDWEHATNTHRQVKRSS